MADNSVQIVYVLSLDETRHSVYSTYDEAFERMIAFGDESATIHEELFHVALVSQPVRSWRYRLMFMVPKT